MPSSSRFRGLILGLIAVAMFGGSLPATRAGVAHLDPWFFTFGRALIAGMIALTLIVLRRPPAPRVHLVRLGLIALCLVVGFPAALAMAAVTVPAAHGGVVLGLLPLATTVAAVVLAGERPSLFFWGLSLVGAALVVAFALRDGSLAIATGDIFLVLAVSLTGVGYALSGIMARTMPGWLVISWALVLSLPVTATATWALWPADAAAVPWSSWIGLAYAGIFAQFLAYALWNAALAAGGVARVGQLQLIQPFATIAIATFFLGESVDGETIGFAVAVVAVVALSRRAAIGQRPAPPGG